MFTLTDAHRRLLKGATVFWNPIESGAPAILVSPMESQGTAEEIQADIARRAGLVTGSGPVESTDLQRAKTLLDELPEAFAQMLAHGKLPAGHYEYTNPLVDSPATPAVNLPPELSSLATDKIVTFDFTDQHAALLRAARWWGLWMNDKRTYGDMTYFELDIAAILHQPVARDQKGNLPADQEQTLWKLHTETLPALQVYLQKAEIAPGEYPSIVVDYGPMPRPGG
jgi:hypothetical protein